MKRVNLMSIKKQVFSGLLIFAGFIFSNPVLSFTQACQLVAQMAGPAYETEPLRVASFEGPDDMPSEFGLAFLGQNGAWFIYQAEATWFVDRETCIPKIRLYGNKRFEFSPVLINQQTGHNAVVTPSFMLKTYREEDIHKIAERYDFRLLTLMPSGKAAIFDVSGVASYDKMLEELDRDKDIQFAVPVLAEPRHRLR